MKPRRYRLGQRQAGVEKTRERILAAAREVLMGEGGLPASPSTRWRSRRAWPE